MKELILSEEINTPGIKMQNKHINAPKEYIKDIESLFSRMPVVNVYQLKKYLRKVYGEKAFRGDAEYAIKEYLRRGIILTDGYYCFSKAAVYSAFKNRIEFNDFNVSEIIRVKEKLTLKEEYQSLMNCFDFVIETLPYSSDFFVCDEIFPVSYIDREKQKLIQICYFPGNNTMEYNMLIDYRSKNLTEEMKQHLSRIAVISDEKTAEAIGQYGFSSIVMFDEDEERRMHIIESRKEKW